MSVVRVVYVSVIRVVYVSVVRAKHILFCQSVKECQKHIFVNSFVYI